MEKRKQNNIAVIVTVVVSALMILLCGIFDFMLTSMMSDQQTDSMVRGNIKGFVLFGITSTVIILICGLLLNYFMRDRQVHVIAPDYVLKAEEERKARIKAEEERDAAKRKAAVAARAKDSGMIGNMDEINAIDNKPVANKPVANKPAGNQSLAEQIQKNNQVAQRVGGPKSGSVKCLNGAYSGSLIEVKPEGLVIGRDQQVADLVFYGSSISRKHCSIKFDSNRNLYVVTDFSTYGVSTSEGQKLERNVPTYVRPGIILYMGLDADQIKMELR